LEWKVAVSVFVSFVVVPGTIPANQFPIVCHAPVVAVGLQTPLAARNGEAAAANANDIAEATTIRRWTMHRGPEMLTTTATEEGASMRLSLREREAPTVQNMLSPAYGGHKKIPHGNDHRRNSPLAFDQSLGRNFVLLATSFKPPPGW
jgi:hypothetical protein